MDDKPASKLPQEDQPDIRPELQARENGGFYNPRGDTAGRSAWGASDSTAGSSGGTSDSAGASDGGYTDSTRGPGNGANDTAGGSDSGATSSTGGLYNPDGGERSTDRGGLDAAEKAAGLAAAAAGPAGGIKAAAGAAGRFFFGTNRRRVGTGVAGVTIGGAIAFFSFVSGPMQLVHLSQILQKNFHGSESSSENRLGKLFRYWRSGSVGETRLGVLGRKSFATTMSQLKDIGIEFNTNSLDHVRSATIDTSKLSKNFPELEGMSREEARAFVADKLGLPENTLGNLGSGSDVGGHKFAVNTRDFGVGATRALAQNTLALLQDGKIVSAMKFRPMTKFFNLPSLFSPLDRKIAEAQDRAVNKAEARKREEQRQQKITQQSVEESVPSKNTLKDKIKDPKNVAAGALLLTGGMCLIRSVADDVVTLNRTAIVVPAALQATDKIAVGSQVQSNQIGNVGQAGAIAQGFNDNSGNIWQGMALEATAGKSQTGKDIPYEYKQAFSNDTTAQHIKDTIGSPHVAGIDIGAITCSTPGLIIQGIAGIALAVGSIIAAVPSGGASIAAEISKAGAGAAATAGAAYLLEQKFADILKDDAVVPDVLSGPLGGNLLAYGAREASNISARASGGVELGDTESAMLDQQMQQDDQAQFDSKNFFARMFDAKDYRSMTGRIADSVSPSTSQNVASLAHGLTNLGSLFTNAFSALLPKSHAAGAPYNWGFPEYGIPQGVLNSSDVEDPYANADAVAQILDGGDPAGYIGRAKTCFGVDISRQPDGWDVVPNDAVNPNSDSYVSAHCNDTSDEGWRRVMLFVFDTNTMKAVACYQNDEQSCTDLGMGGASVAANTTSQGSTGTVASGDATELARQILDNSNINLGCLSSSVRQDVEDAAAGKVGTAGAPVNPLILKLIATLGQQHKVCVTAIESNGQGHSAGSAHYSGDAVDFGSLDDVKVTGRNEPSLSIIQTASSILPAGTGVGQSQCGATPTLPSGWTTFEDTCNHLHIQVPRD